MSFQINSNEGLASMQRAQAALMKIEEEMKTVEESMGVYQSSLQNDITTEADTVFKQLHSHIDAANDELQKQIDNINRFLKQYKNIVGEGL